MNTKEPLQKHKHVFILYSLLLKKKGEDAKFIAKNKLYSDVSRFFYINKTMAARIILELQRVGFTPTKLDYEEFYNTVEGLNNIIENEG